MYKGNYLYVFSASGSVGLENELILGDGFISSAYKYILPAVAIALTLVLNPVMALFRSGKYNNAM